MARSCSFLWPSSTPLFTYTTSSLFICLGHLGYFPILAIINNAVINVGVHIFFQTSEFIFFGLRSDSGITGSYGGSIFNFEFFQEPPFIFCNGCPVYIPTNSVQQILFFHRSLILHIIYFLLSY